MLCLCRGTIQTVQCTDWPGNSNQWPIIMFLLETNFSTFREKPSGNLPRNLPQKPSAEPSAKTCKKRSGWERTQGPRPRTFRDPSGILPETFRRPFREKPSAESSVMKKLVSSRQPSAKTFRRTFRKNFPQNLYTFGD